MKNDCKKVKCFGYTVIVYNEKHERKNATVAKLQNRKAYAYCHPDDTFDFEIGAKLAVHRLVKGLLKEDTANATKLMSQIESRKSKIGDLLAGVLCELERVNTKIYQNCTK